MKSQMTAADVDTVVDNRFSWGDGMNGGLWIYVTMKMIEKLDNLLDEADEYIMCSSAHADDSDLKSAYLDLSRCHLDGYEKLAKCCDHSIERKIQSTPDGDVLRQMYAWHKNKFDERAATIKHKLEQER